MPRSQKVSLNVQPQVTRLSVGHGYPPQGNGGATATWEEITGKPDFAAVAETGAYDDLTGLPTLFDGQYDSLSGAPTLASVATTGDYVDLSNLPTIPSAPSDVGAQPADPRLAAIVALANAGFIMLDGDGNVFVKPELLVSDLPVGYDYQNLINRPDVSALDELESYLEFASFPDPGDSEKLYIDLSDGIFYRWDGVSSYVQLTGRASIWGQISGLLSNQSDLIAELNTRDAANRTFSTNRDNHTGSQGIPTVTGLQTALDSKESAITAGTTAQYRRGDKTWQTLNKEAVELGNVDNTADVDKPVSTAMQNALDLKAGFVDLASITEYSTSGNLSAGFVLANLSGSGPYVLRGFYGWGSSVTLKVTVDGGSPITYAGLNGQDSGSDLFRFCAFPFPVKANLSLLVEVNSGSTRATGAQCFIET